MEQLVKIMLQYYGDNKPNTVEEYMKNYPKGYSRTALKKNFGITVSKLLEAINNKYKNVYTLESSVNNLITICNKLNITLNTDISQYKSIRKVQLEFICNKCNDVYKTTYDSLKLCKYGCSNCAGNKPLNYTYVKDLLHRKYPEYEVLNMPLQVSRESMTGSYVLLKHKCGTELKRNLTHIFYRNTDRMCHNCWPSNVYSCDFEGNTFNSKFELQCYKQLSAVCDISLHVRYSVLSNKCLKRWVCDFVINTFIIEVTSYNEDSEYSKFKKHADTLIEKELFVNTFLPKYKFVVIRSLPELDTFIHKHLI